MITIEEIEKFRATHKVLFAQEVSKSGDKKEIWFSLVGNISVIHDEIAMYHGTQVYAAMETFNSIELKP